MTYSALPLHDLWYVESCPQKPVSASVKLFLLPVMLTETCFQLSRAVLPEFHAFYINQAQSHHHSSR